MATPYFLVSGDVGRLGASNHPYRPLAMPFRALNMVARTSYESLGGQHLIAAAIPGLSQERCWKLLEWISRGMGAPHRKRMLFVVAAASDNLYSLRQISVGGPQSRFT